jgi:hypothetical protein
MFTPIPHPTKQNLPQGRAIPAAKLRIADNIRAGIICDPAVIFKKIFAVILVFSGYNLNH